MVDQVRKLPDTDLTREIAIRLAAPADGEQLLLHRPLASDGSLTETILALPKNPAKPGYRWRQLGKRIGAQRPSRLPRF